MIHIGPSVHEGGSLRQDVRLSHNISDWEICHRCAKGIPSQNKLEIVPGRVPTFFVPLLYIFTFESRVIGFIRRENRNLRTSVSTSLSKGPESASQARGLPTRLSGRSSISRAVTQPQHAD